MNEDQNKTGIYRSKAEDSVVIGRDKEWKALRISSEDLQKCLLQGGTEEIRKLIVSLLEEECCYCAVGTIRNCSSWLTFPFLVHHLYQGILHLIGRKLNNQGDSLRDCKTAQVLFDHGAFYKAEKEARMAINNQIGLNAELEPSRLPSDLRWQGEKEEATVIADPWNPPLWFFTPDFKWTLKEKR